MSIWRGSNWFMSALFLLAVVVQFNDPDPLRWIALYGAALSVCFVTALRGRIHVSAPLLVMSVAAAWGVFTMADVPGAGTYMRMFDAWEMQSIAVEEAREASGLLIVAAWMAVIAVAARRREKS